MGKMWRPGSTTAALCSTACRTRFWASYSECKTTCESHLQVQRL